VRTRLPGWAAVAASPAEVAAPRPGDDLLPVPDVVMDRAFTVSGAPGEVWRGSTRRARSSTRRGAGTPT
jgi:hypothetical protein